MSESRIQSVRVARLALVLLLLTAMQPQESELRPARVEECVRVVEAAFPFGDGYSRLIEKYGSQSGEATVFKDHHVEYVTTELKLGGPGAIAQIDPEVRTECGTFYGESP
jgi:hypothetical protein